MEEYSLITLGWKSLDNIKNVYKDALDSTHKPKEFIVIVNPYDYKETELIEKYITKQENTRYVLCSHNIGIGVAWNLGMYISKTNYCIIVNDDCRVGKHTYGKMIKEFSNPKVGSVGVTWGGKAEDKRPTPQGFLIAFRREMILEIGGFKEFYNPFADERELCLRAWTEGWKSVIAENCSWQHIHDISNNPYQTISYLGDLLVPRVLQIQTEPVMQKLIDKYNLELSNSNFKFSR